MKKARNVLNKKIHFGNKNKDAQKYYAQAAEVYLQSNMFPAAGDAYCKSAWCYEQMGESTKAANNYSLASEAYLQDTLFDETKEAYSKSMDALQKASQIYTSNGQTAQAARKEKEIADRLSEESMMDVDVLHLAIEAYERAIDHFTFQGSYATANSCMEKIAYIYIKIKHYKEASQAWKELLNAEWNTSNSTTGGNSLIRHVESKYMFYILLCKLASLNNDPSEEDLELFWMDMEAMGDRGQNFGKSREFELLVGVYQAFKQKDLKVFLRVVKKTLEVLKMEDPAKETLLFVRKKLENAISAAFIAEDEDGEIDLT